MKQITREWLAFLREQYPVGSRIRLNSMEDPYAPVEPGTMGTLQRIDDAGQFLMKWDNGRTLSLIPGEDSFSLILPEPTMMKLYMPLHADLYTKDDWSDTSEEPEMLTGRALMEYEDSILIALIKNRMSEEAERGIMRWYRLLNALDEIGIKSTKEIVYQEILNYGSFGYLEPHFDEYTMLEELNALAQKLAVFDRVDSIAFEGLVKMAEQKPEPFGVKELINFAHSTESCHVVSDVFDDEQLGRFYAGNGFMPEYETLPDKIYEHLDFAKIGREARESEGGVFTQRGYRRCTWTSHG